MCMSTVCAQKGVWGVCLFLYFGFGLGPLEEGFNLGGWARRSRAVLQLCNTRCCVCDKNTTQDIVCVKMQHTISGSESVASTQDIVMQFRNVVNISQ